MNNYLVQHLEGKMRFFGCLQNTLYSVSALLIIPFFLMVSMTIFEILGVCFGWKDTILPRWILPGIRVVVLALASTILFFSMAAMVEFGARLSTATILIVERILYEERKREIQPDTS